MDRKPVFGEWNIDFAGGEYQEESLPAVQDCEEGDTCQLCWPGGSGWYQSWYELRGGEWVETGTTAPWQMFV